MGEIGAALAAWWVGWQLEGLFCLLFTETILLMFFGFGGGNAHHSYRWVGGLFSRQQGP